MRRCSLLYLSYNLDMCWETMSWSRSRKKPSFRARPETSFKVPTDAAAKKQFNINGNRCDEIIIRGASKVVQLTKKKERSAEKGPNSSKVDKKKIRTNKVARKCSSSALSRPVSCSRPPVPERDVRGCWMNSSKQQFELLLSYFASVGPPEAGGGYTGAVRGADVFSC